MQVIKSLRNFACGISECLFDYYWSTSNNSVEPCAMKNAQIIVYTFSKSKTISNTSSSLLVVLTWLEIRIVFQRIFGTTPYHLNDILIVISD